MPAVNKQKGGFKMSNLKDFIKERQECERINLREAKNDHEESLAYAIKWALVDVQRELEKNQLEMLKQIERDVDNLKGMVETKVESGIIFFNTTISSELNFYKIIFGEKELSKITLDSAKKTIAYGKLVKRIEELEQG